MIKMDEHDATELAYKNGFAAGYAAGRQSVAEEKHGRWLPQILLGQRVWDCSECKTLGSPHWKRCPVCEAKMDLPRITDQTQAALEALGRKAHGEE
jgi:rubrerythrin